MLVPASGGRTVSGGDDRSTEHGGHVEREGPAQMSTGDAPTWPELLHTLWRSAFAAGSTKVFAKELYLGLLELPHVRGVLGARIGPDESVRVVRWADHDH